MLWIALAFVVAMMVGFLIPRKPLSLNLSAPPKSPEAPKPTHDDSSTKRPS